MPRKPLHSLIEFSTSLCLNRHHFEPIERVLLGRVDKAPRRPTLTLNFDEIDAAR